MAKIPRVFHRVFGSNAGPTEVGQFGSFVAGSPTYTSNIDTIMGLANWASGWLSAVVGDPQPDPFLEDENSVDLVHSQQIGYILQQGIAEWDNRTTYYSGSFCTRNGLPYTSIQDANTNQDPATQTAWWIPYDSTRTGSIVAFGGLSLPFGYGLCDGSAISRTTYAALFNAITAQTTGNTVNGSPIISSMVSTANMQAGFNITGPGIPAGTTIVSVDSASQIHISVNATATAAGVALVAGPWGLGDGTTTFNRPDMRGRAIIGSGTGSGLTARTQGAKTGEETHQLTTAELANHNHTLHDPTHSHNLPLSNGAGADATGASGANATSPPAYNVVQSAGTGITIDAAGGNAAHNNMQPSVACPWMIKY